MDSSQLVEILATSALGLVIGYCLTAVGWNFATEQQGPRRHVVVPEVEYEGKVIRVVATVKEALHAADEALEEIEEKNRHYQEH